MIINEQVYVVGGIVDPTLRMYRTYDTAKAQNVTTRRLPILEHLPPHMSSVLNINSVVGVLCSYQHLQSWKLALEENFPSRKLC